MKVSDQNRGASVIEITSWKDLDVWKVAHQAVLQIYQLTKSFRLMNGFDSSTSYAGLQPRCPQILPKVRAEALCESISSFSR